jgi:SOS-response transcriptional repressor LexA
MVMEHKLPAPVQRLVAARKKAGFKSARAAAIELGWAESSYRAHENGTRNYDRDMARTYARAYGVDPKTLYLDVDGDELATAGQDAPGPVAILPPAAPPLMRQRQISSDTAGIEFAGFVEAGAWREVDELDQRPPRRFARPRDSRYPEARQYIWEVVGDSMDLANIPHGIMVLGVDYQDFCEKYGVLSDGRYVVVEKHENGRQERTIKEVKMFRDRMELHPRSSNPVHKPIVICINHEVDGDKEVKILAIVSEAFWLF